MPSKRIELRLTPFVEERLILMGEMFGMERQQILLAAFAQYMPDIQPPIESKKPRQRRTKKEEKTEEPKLGSGNRPKDVEEVAAYFRQRNIREPIEPKAQLFFDHYQSKGWLIGKSPCKRWGLCLTGWLSSHPDWAGEPVVSKKKVKIAQFLSWAKEVRPPVYEKYKDCKSIDEINQFYVDEYFEDK